MAKLGPSDAHAPVAKKEEQDRVKLRVGSDVVCWESTVSTSGHFGERGNVDFVLRLRKQLFGFDLDNEAGVDIARIPGPQGAKVIRI